MRLGNKPKLIDEFIGWGEFRFVGGDIARVQSRRDGRSLGNAGVREIYRVLRGILQVETNE